MMDATAFAKPLTHHADGIYFGLDKQEYLDDPALGSSDHKQLAFSPADYWWTRLNPARVERTTEPLELGTAVHLAVLEGREAFEARYMRGPDQDGMTSSEKAQSTKAANQRAERAGKVCIKAEQYDRCLIAAAMITKNPKLATAFSGGAAEVSAFWTVIRGDGKPIRKKARFDYLKPRGIGDLKRVANQHEVPFPRACLNAITNYLYHVQAKHYLDARAMLPALLKAGHSFGQGTDDQRQAVASLIDGIRAAEKIDAGRRFAFQFVFWQGERAPLTWSRVISPANPICEIAERVIERAEANYLSYMAEFGPDQMWIEYTEPAELYVEDLPPWFARD